VDDSAGFLTQYWHVQTRLFRAYWRDTDLNFTRLFIVLIIGVLFGLVWFDLKSNDQAGVSSKIGVLFMPAGFHGVLNCASVSPVMARLRSVYYRERASNTYGAFVFALSYAIVELPYVAVSAFLFSVPMYFLVGLSSAAEDYFRYYFAFYIEGLCITYAGHFFAASMPNVTVVSILQGLYFALTFLFGGVFVPHPDIPRTWAPAQWIDCIYQGLISLSYTQFKCDAEPCPSISIVEAGQQKTLTIVDYVQTTYGFTLTLDYYWYSIGWLFLILGVTQIFTILSFKYINWQKK